MPAIDASTMHARDAIASLSRECATCRHFDGSHGAEMCSKGETPIPRATARDGRSWPACGPFGAFWASRLFAPVRFEP